MRARQRDEGGSIETPKPPLATGLQMEYAKHCLVFARQSRLRVRLALIRGLCCHPGRSNVDVIKKTKVALSYQLLL